MSGYICEELIFEILTRLPAKSLLRFRSVCKSWYSCIGSPGFIGTHTFRSPKKFLIKYQQSKSEGFYTLNSQDQLPFCPGRGYIGITPTPFGFPYLHDIIGLCNGILCLFDYNKKHISLWNPTIRRKLPVPDCPRRYFLGVAIGFGFDQITYDYKIVIIPITECGGILNTSFVYAMKTGAWSVIAFPTPTFYQVMTPKACFVDGALHWVVKSRDTCIMTFDLSSHVFGMIALPKLGRITIGLTTIQGSLAMISFYLKHVNSWIWVRKDASWFVVFKSKTNHLGEDFKSKTNHLGEVITTVLELNSGGDLLFKTEDGRLQVYNLDRGAQSTLNSASWLDDIGLCAESLHLLDMGTAC